jgi:hypothetical protein
MNLSNSVITSKVEFPILDLDIDDTEIRRDINNPIVKKLYNLYSSKQDAHMSLNDLMDDNDKKEFFEQLKQFYYPDGFFTTNRVAQKGFTPE